MFSVSVSVAALAAVLVALAALRLLQKQTGGRPSVQRLVRCAVIAAVYVVLCLVLAPFSYGAVQVRIAEALCLLPVFGAEYIVGVTLGCFLANLFGSTILDVVFGTLATLIAAVMTYRLRKIRTKKGLPLAACVPPVLVNAVIVGAEITYIFMPETASLPVLGFNMLTVGIGEVISVGILGVALVRVIEKTPALKKIFTEW